MAGEYRVDTLAVPETLNLLHDLLDRVREDHPDVESTDLMLFETAVIEIANNVVEHGRPPGTIRYSFTLDVESDQLLGHLSDGGPPLEAPHAPMPGTDLDDLVYERVGEHNEWTMIRRRR